MDWKRGVRSVAGEPPRDPAVRAEGRTPRAKRAGEVDCGCQGALRLRGRGLAPTPGEEEGTDQEYAPQAIDRSRERRDATSRHGLVLTTSDAVSQARRAVAMPYRATSNPPIRCASQLITIGMPAAAAARALISLRSRRS